MIRGCTPATGSKRRPRSLAARGAELVRGRAQPDRRRLARPARSRRRPGWRCSPTSSPGKSSAEKRTEIADWLSEHQADAAVLSALDSIAWTFNVRGAGRQPHAGRPGLRPGQCRRHRRPVRRPREDRPRRRASISATASGCTSARISSARWRGFEGKSVAVDPERSVAAIFEALNAGGATIVAHARPDGACQGDQEPGRDRRPPRRAGPRRRGDCALPALGRAEAPKGGLDELQASDQLEAFRAESGDAPRPVVRHHLRRRPERRDRPLPLDRGDQPPARAGLALSDRFGRPICRRHHRHHPHRARSASRPPRCATASPGCSRAISPSPPRSSRRARAGRSSTASRGGPCGRPGSIMPMAPATASAASCRCTKGRSGFRPRDRARRAATSRCARA